jgi:ribosome-associated protein
MPDLVVNPRLTIPADELSVAFARSGGSGGQNVNKVSSKVDLRWCPVTSRALSPADREWLLTKLGGRLTTSGELIVTSERSRDQIVNRGDAEAKLVAIVQAALVRPKPRRATRPSRGSKERRIAAKKGRAQVKTARGRVRDE